MSIESGLSFREATIDDLPELIALFAGDSLGGHGDTTDASIRPLYEEAFATIHNSSSNMLLVGTLNGEVVATAQLTFMISLIGRGRKRMAIEAVQTRADKRGLGIGAGLIEHCLQVGRARDVSLVQLTSSNKRPDAHRFYERLGFEKSHAGFKLQLKAGPAST